MHLSEKPPFPHVGAWTFSESSVVPEKIKANRSFFLMKDIKQKGVPILRSLFHIFVKHLFTWSLAKDLVLRVNRLFPDSFSGVEGGRDTILKSPVPFIKSVRFCLYVSINWIITSVTAV